MAASETKRSQKHSGAAEKMIERMKGYPSFRPDQVTEYVKAFERMIGEFGAERTNRGLTSAVDTIGPFPPTPAEIRKLIPAENAETCGKCRNGWIVTNPEAKTSEQVVKRCECCQ